MKLQLSTLFTILYSASAFAANAPAANPLFEKDEVHVIRLNFKDPNFWAKLQANYAAGGEESIYTEASFEWRDLKYEKIGVRFKGNSSYSASRGNKKPFRIKLTEYVKGQSIDGIKSFNLNNLWNDPSAVREKAYYEIANNAGMPAPRSNFAALYINGDYWGLYGLGEVVNDDFLDSRFKGDNKGSLYKGDPSGSFDDRGDDEATYTTLYEKKTNETESWADIVYFIKVLNRYSDADLPGELEKILDVDSVLKGLALDAVTCNYDNYNGMGHNFYIYKRPSDGKFEWLVWDPSLAFGAFGVGTDVAGMKNLSLYWTSLDRAQGGIGGGMIPPGGIPPGVIPPGGQPGGGMGGNFPTGQGRALATRLFKNPVWRARYLQFAKQFIDGAAEPLKVANRMQQMRDVVWPWAQMDWQFLTTYAEFEKAMAEDQTLTAVGGGFGGGGGGMFPGGGMGGGGAVGQAIPGINALLRDRTEAVRKQVLNPTYP